MGLTVPGSGGPAAREPIPMGMHPAVCSSVIDVGTSMNDFNGKMMHKIMVIWELPEFRGEFTDRVTKERKSMPRVISKEYTLSLFDRANLRRDLEEWRGKPFTKEEEETFDLFKLIGQPCLLMVKHKVRPKGVYAEIAGIMPNKSPIKGENPPIAFKLPDDLEAGIPLNIPDWIQQKIMKSEEYRNWRDAKNTLIIDQSHPGDPVSLDSDEPPF